MTDRYTALYTVFVRLRDTLDRDGPASETVAAIATEVSSAGITANCHVGLDPRRYHDEPELAAEYCLGQALNWIERHAEDDDPLHRLYMTNGMLNAMHRFGDELLPIPESVTP